jgi:peroxiredoxin
MDLGFEVVDMGESDHPTEGEQAPDFTRPLVDDEYWEDIALSELEGPVCLVFHSMDGAFPGTYIWSELRDRGFDDLGATVVGLSISTPYAHKRLIEDNDLGETEFRFFSDPANSVAEQYGITNNLDGMTGVAEPRPATFVLDEDRTVRHAWVAREWPDLPDYDDLEAAVVEAVEAADGD